MKVIKPTKGGVKAALNSMGYFTEIPKALKPVTASESFNDEEMAFAKYLVFDTDCGGAWNDSEQINMHLA